MKPWAKFLRRILPLLISVTLLAIMVSYTPWSKVGVILSDFDLGTILILITLSLAYYGLKAVRFWYILQAMDIHQPLGTVMISYMSAQPVTLLPAGEIYRSRALERHTGVPVRSSLPQFTMQGLFEGGAMAAIGIISALALGRLRLPVIALALVVIGSGLLIRNGYVASITKLLARLPFIHVTNRNIIQFSNHHQAMLTRYWLPRLFGLSLIIELIGAAIAYTAVVGLGAHINGYQAVLVYVIPLVVGFLSLLPGGLGASEQSAIGILLLSHVSVAHAVASTLIMRLTIVGLGLVYGGIAMVVAHRYLPPGRAAQTPSPSAK
ncbi:MAG TPA: lysylphosphatidylglycerol synthase transmembrane domain-containing protein [Candidatus Saccharimonadales bacterium]|nr:lysylphosphatidylglycerol synthase transmembrane domain-containing protein [Candidatus Saccharimonadales bacterium]